MGGGATTKPTYPTTQTWLSDLVVGALPFVTRMMFTRKNICQHLPLQYSIGLVLGLPYDIDKFVGLLGVRFRTRKCKLSCQTGAGFIDLIFVHVHIEKQHLDKELD